METTLYKVIFTDGRMFKVFCANKKQKERFNKSIDAVMKHDAKAEFVPFTNGIHDIKKWEQIVKTLNLPEMPGFEGTWERLNKLTI